MVSETRHLDSRTPPPGRQAARRGRARHAVRAAAAAALSKLAYEADRAGYVARGRTARTDRRVGLRPAPDTMSVLTGFLPVEQGVACLAALRTHTDTVVAAGDARTRDQIMADTLVERVTGQATATDVNVEVGIVIPVDALLDPDQQRHRRGHRVRPGPRRDRPRPPRRHPRPTLVAATVHRPHTALDRRPTPAADASTGRWPT